jgi:Electron transfer flavoprotein, alpha subunit
VDSSEYENYSTDAYTHVITVLAEKYKPSAILFGATQDGRDFAPRAAAKINTGCIADCIGLSLDEEKNIVWTCPSFGGNIYTDLVCSEARPQMGTIRSSTFKKGEADASREGEIVKETVSFAQDELKAKVIKAVKEISESVNLEEAEIIISGGRGMGSAENFKLLWDFAALMGGVVGATRAPIEAGWISRAHQIGQSGKSVAPKLYIACGISGATQHVAGVTGADYIVAINKDEEASIFDIANVGIVGNVMEVIPAMMEEIKKQWHNKILKGDRRLSFTYFFNIHISTNIKFVRILNF